MKNTEFKTKQFKDATVYTLESATGIGSGSIASVSSPIGGVRRRGDNLIAQEEKKEAPKPRNFVAKNAKMGGAGQHKDKKKEQKQGNEKHKKPYMEDHEVSMASNELKSIHSDAKQLLGLVQQYGENGDLEAWQQSKITKAADYLNSVLQSIGGEQGVDEAVEDRTSYQVAKVLSNHGITYDPAKESELIKAIGMVLVKELNMSPRQARAVMNDEDFLGDTMGELRHMEQGVAEGDRPFRGVGGAFNRGDDERHDLDPTEWYIVKDGKMFKTSVYPNQVQLAIAQGYSRTRDEAKAKAGEQGVAEATGDERFDTMMGKITGGAGARQGVDNLNKSLTARTGSDPETALAKWGQEFIKWLEDLCRNFARQGVDRFSKLEKLSEFEDGGETMAHWLIEVAKQTKTMGITLADIQEFSSEFNTHGMWPWQQFPIAWSQNEWQDYKDQWTGPDGYIANLRHSPEQGVAEVSDATLTSYLTKLDKDNLKHRMDPTKRSDTKRMKSGPNFVKAFTKLDNRKQGVAEGDAYMESLAAKLAEKIPKNAPVDVWIKDFEKSNAPQFRGKNLAKRKQMAVAASYAAKNPSKKK